MRYKLTIEYDGSSLLGWQRQNDGPSVQEHLETALALFLGLTPLTREEYAELKNAEDNEEETSKKHKIMVYAAGRTDAGVHATGQVVHFNSEKEIDPFRIREGLNFHLRNEAAPVCVLDVEPVDDNFHARFSAQGRAYLYRILNRRAPAVIKNNRVWWVPVPLDVEKMRQGAKHLLGKHDFSSFRAAACQAKSPVKTLDRLDIEVLGEEIHFIVEARSFLHHQVRNMVGALKMVGDGHLRPDDIKTMLEAKDRKAGGVNAPACGLYLTKVVY